MKKKWILIGGLLGFLLNLASLSYGADKERVSLRISGGLSRFALGDFNAFIIDTQRFQLDNLRSVGYSATEEFKTLHGGRDLEVSILFPLGQGFSLAVGTGLLTTGSADNLLVLVSSFSRLTTDLSYNIKTIPVTAGIRINLPLSSAMSVVVFGGGGLYFARFTETGDKNLILFSGTRGYEKSWDVETSAAGWGGFAGLGIELRIIKGLSLLVEASGRLARISGFSGDSRTLFYSSENKESLKLLYYEFSPSGGGAFYSALNLPDAPIGYPLRTLRDAVIDFSGWSIRTGFKITL
ncbi:MAG: hypothetical protein KJ908_04220 [Acidobacteria bacterium]|nr:hypothetical protein [Acidobacteriota bacterium]